MSRRLAGVAALLTLPILTYRYRLRNSQREESLAQAVAWFDPFGRELRRVQVRYRRYEMDADFVMLNAAIRLRL